MTFFKKKSAEIRLTPIPGTFLRISVYQKIWLRSNLFLNELFSFDDEELKILKDAEQQRVSNDPVLINVVIYVEKRDNCKSPFMII